MMVPENPLYVASLEPTRVAHLRGLGDGGVRFERVRDWQVEARKVRALLVLIAFVKVALEHHRPAALVEPNKLDACKGGIPFRPIGRVDVATLLREACSWYAHGVPALNAGVVLNAVAREVSRRVDAARCRYAFTLHTPMPPVGAEVAPVTKTTSPPRPSRRMTTRRT